jgi:hypothetical protein
MRERSMAESAAIGKIRATSKMSKMSSPYVKQLSDIQICRAALAAGDEKIPCCRARGHSGNHATEDGHYTWIDPNPKSKFHNTKVTIDGLSFDSLGEASHFVVLEAKLRRGEIKNLVCHPSFELKIGSVRIGKYTADFSYEQDGVTIVEDYKASATKTEAYGLRKKLMLALHGIKVIEVGPATKKKRKVKKA